MRVATGDYALWQAYKDGDKGSFQTIYFEHFHPLFEYGLRLVGDRELVEDAIQDLFVKLWNNRSTLGDVSAIRPYLLVSLRTTLFGHLEKNNRMKLTELGEHHPFGMEFSVESAYIQKEGRSLQARRLIEALNQLTPRQKEVIYLRYFEELEYEEIAAILGITVKATYKLTARGLEALRQILNLSNSSLLALLALVSARFL